MCSWSHAFLHESLNMLAYYIFKGNSCKVCHILNLFQYTLQFSQILRLFLFAWYIVYLHLTLCVPLVAGTFLAITRQLLELESCSNPLRIQQVFWLKSNKNVFCFRWGVHWGDCHKWRCFGNFGHLWLALGPNLLTHSFHSKFYWK